MKKLKNNQAGIAHLLPILGVLVVLVIALAGWKVWSSKDAKKNSSSTTTNSSKAADTTEAKAAEKNETMAAEKAAPAAPVAEAKKFTFVDTTGWVKRTSKDGVTSIDAGGQQTYGFCKSNPSSVLLGMVYMNQTNEYDCGSLKTAVSWGKTSNGSNLLLTRIAFGPAEELWGRGNAKAVEVKLKSGEKASRYEYSNTIDGKTYNTIEYVTTHNGKNYMAILHWEADFNINNGSNISSDYFDTVVQKTWTIN
jgi:hypothetical protein